MYYKRKLPHWQPNHAEFFITFRLADSLPQRAIEKIKSEKRLLERKLYNAQQVDRSDKLSDLRKKHRLLFNKYEDQLDSGSSGPTWLSKPSIANTISEAIHYRDGSKYDLYAYCIMPNHVHMVIKMISLNKDRQIPALTSVLKSLKSFTALKANRILNRTGQFWQHESFDRVIRNAEELESTIKYVLNNPAKANLIDKWQDWPYSYCKSKFKVDLM